jgi:hypothetical protein
MGSGAPLGKSLAAEKKFGLLAFEAGHSKQRTASRRQAGQNWRLTAWWRTALVDLAQKILVREELDD